MRNIFLMIFVFFMTIDVYAQKLNAQIDIMSPQNEPKQTYNVEIADTPQKISTGLMWRKNLPENHGMWFDMTVIDAKQPIAFWMKNTLIELDILFIDNNNEIFYIKENAKPHDTTLIWPPKRPSYVLEINGGQCQKQNIKIGDVIHKQNIN